MAAVSSPATSMVIAFCYGWIASVGARRPLLARHRPASAPFALGQGKWWSFLRDSFQGQLLFDWNWPQLSRQQERRPCTDRRRRKESRKWISLERSPQRGRLGPREIIGNKVLGPRARLHRLPRYTPPPKDLLFLLLENHSRVSPRSSAWMYRTFHPWFIIFLNSTALAASSAPADLTEYVKCESFCSGVWVRWLSMVAANATLLSRSYNTRVRLLHKDFAKVKHSENTLFGQSKFRGRLNFSVSDF